MELRPQPGKQEQFLASSADITIYGGAAGGGKSFALLLEPLRHVHNQRFGGVIFRRTSNQITGPGSLWEDAETIYPHLGATMRQHPYLEVEFPSGATLQFTHLQHKQDVLTHHGKQYAFIGFDELTHFEEFQFWYMVSRMRSISGIKPYMRCTTNPDPDSFVRSIIDWWIGEDGYPIEERSGVVRWFVRVSGVVHWADTPQELIAAYGENKRPKSLTFIPAKLEDNPILCEADPDYEGWLDALPQVEVDRLKGGNWNVRYQGGKYIQRDYFERRWTTLPKNLAIYMASDFAVTEPEDDGDEPDFTEHGVFGIDPNDDIYVIDWWYGQTQADVWIDVLLDMWAKHKQRCWFGEGGVIRRAIEPLLKKRMKERKLYSRVEWVNPTGRQPRQSSSREGFSDRSKQAKAIRGRPFQARAAQRKIIMPADAPWLSHVIELIVNFPAKGKDDPFDVLSMMCLVIDTAHPAVAPMEQQPVEPRKRWQRSKTKNWRTA